MHLPDYGYYVNCNRNYIQLAVINVEQEYADAMKMLARQYYEHEISKSVYREKRKLLVDHMDNEFNGDKTPGRTDSKAAITEMVKPVK